MIFPFDARLASLLASNLPVARYVKRGHSSTPLVAILRAPMRQQMASTASTLSETGSTQGSTPAFHSEVATFRVYICFTDVPCNVDILALSLLCLCPMNWPCLQAL